MAHAISLLAQAAAIFLALVATTAAVHKIVEPVRTRAATEKLTGGSPLVAGLLWRSAIAIELAGMLIVLPWARTVGAAVLASLWVSYAVALVLTSRREGSPVDCGCHFGRHAPVDPAGAASRAAAFAVAAALVGMAPAYPLTSIEVALLALPGLAALLFYLVADQLNGRQSLEVRS